MTSNTHFDPWHSYSESPEEQIAIKERAKVRDALKAEYRKNLTNPFKLPLHRVHDKELQRWYSSRVTHAEFIVPSQRLGLVWGCFFLLTGSFIYWMNKDHARYEDRLANGEVPYRERVIHRRP